MKILVIDDNVNHRRAAVEFLAEHDVYCVSTYDEAEKELTPRDEKWKPLPVPYDVVLIDLMLPASKAAQGPKGMKYVGQEMPLGTTLAFLALSRGLKRVAVVTDTNHHNHPASAAFDVFQGMSNRGRPITVGDARVILSGERVMDVDAETFSPVSYKFLTSAEGKRKYPYSDMTGEYEGLLRVKDWHGVLDDLFKAD